MACEGLVVIEAAAITVCYSPTFPQPLAYHCQPQCFILGLELLGGVIHRSIVLPELREVAEPIVRESLRWMEGVRAERRVRVMELEIEEVEEWTDGSRVDGRAAAATRTEAQYLGVMATIVDAEALGMPLAWERSGVVALDSKGVVERI